MWKLIPVDLDVIEIAGVAASDIKRVKSSRCYRNTNVFGQKGYKRIKWRCANSCGDCCCVELKLVGVEMFSRGVALDLEQGYLYHIG